MTQSERRQFLIRALLREEPSYVSIAVPASSSEQKRLLRALMNVRPPKAKAISDDFLREQDAYLRLETQEKGITDADALPELQPGLALWQGDITTLRCDAIVNAANSGMTGCYVPNHRCIDNCIHTFAGIQLRLDCARIMNEQGFEEPTGQAKITPAYNLPCRYVLHTVGPIVAGAVTEQDCALLESCYRSCLSLAAAHGLKSVAFCCISTGEFHFPNDLAAQIAIQTVKSFLQAPGSIQKVIFNVFKDTDKALYARLLAP